jgi:hypothetical protein
MRPSLDRERVSAGLIRGPEDAKIEVVESFRPSVDTMAVHAYARAGITELKLA